MKITLDIDKRKEIIKLCEQRKREMREEIRHEKLEVLKRYRENEFSKFWGLTTKKPRKKPLFVKEAIKLARANDDYSVFHYKYFNYRSFKLMCNLIELCNQTVIKEIHLEKEEAQYLFKELK